MPSMAGKINYPSTRCPYGHDAMVGSSMCMLCQSFVSYDADSQEVECNRDK